MISVQTYSFESGDDIVGRYRRTKNNPIAVGGILGINNANNANSNASHQCITKAPSDPNPALILQRSFDARTHAMLPLFHSLFFAALSTGKVFALPGFLPISVTKNLMKSRDNQ